MVVLRAALALLLLTACAADEAFESVDELYVVERVVLDELTDVGQRLRRDPTSQEGLLAFLDLVSCPPEEVVFDGATLPPIPVVLQLRAEPAGSQAIGRVAALVTFRISGEGCEGRFRVLPELSYEEDEPLLTGPAALDGRSLEAHLNLGDLQGLSFGISSAALNNVPLPLWWRVDAVLLSGPGPRLREAVADGFATARELDARPADNALVADPTQLANLVANGVQPDVDLDLDGLETFEDRDGDGRVDRCRDGSGEVVDGEGCAQGLAFEDAFRFRFRFLLRLLPDEQVLDARPLNF